MASEIDSTLARKVILVVAGVMGVATGAGAATLDGAVTDPASLPIAGIEVSAYTDDGSGWQLVAYTSTSGDGSYLIDGLADGSYRVLFRDWSQVYAFEYYPDAPTIDLAQDVLLSGTATVDASLDLGGRIAGRVTDAAGVPLEYPMVFAYTAGDEPQLLFVGQVDEPTGIYEVGGLPTSSFLMMFTGRRGLDSYAGYYDGARTISDATPIPVAVGHTTSGIDGRLGPPPGGYPGGIEGFVTASDGSPLPNIEVSLYESTGAGQWTLVDYQSTLTDGSYAFLEIPAGTYTLGFRDWGQTYAFAFWGGGSRLENAIPIEIDDAVMPADADLEVGGRIAGTLTDPSGAPLKNALVFVHTFEIQPQVIFLTSPDPATGAYELGGLPSGDYIIQFSGSQGLDSYNAYFDGAETIDDADPVPVIIGQTTNGIDGVLGIPPGGVIAGRITDPYGRAFDFARVEAYQWDGVQWVLAGAAETLYYESEYELPLPPGEYRLRFEGGSFLQFELPAWEYFDNATTLEQATAVTVTLDQRLEGFDVAVGNLSTGSIAGTVTDAATGNPLAGIEVWLSDRRGRVLYDQIATTAGDGSFTVTGLWPEGYHVELYDPGYTYQTLAVGQILVGEGPVDGIDAAVELAPPGSLAGSITGRVVDPSGAPIFGIRVSAGSIDDSSFGSGFSDSQGRFRVRDLADGDYRVRFSSGEGFRVPEYFDDVRESQDATPVPVLTASTTGGVDAMLDPAGIIAGSITNRFGGEFQIATAVAYAFDGSGWQPVESTSVAYESEYRIEGVPVGTYRVELIGSSFSGLSLREYFDDVATIDLATDVEVLAGEVTDGISGSLGEGPPGAIAGTVAAGSGAPLAGVEVTVYDDEFEPEATVVTTADGTYEVGELYRGRYYVAFEDPTGVYPGEAFDNVSSLDLATPIQVDDVPVTGIDAVLDGSGGGPGGGGIRGVVSDQSTGDPIEGIHVRCVDEYYGPVANCGTHTGPDGSFQLAGFLPAGTYFVQFSAPNGGWVDEWYDDVPQAQDATAIVVAEGSWTDGVDAALAPAGGITGTVTDGNGAAFPRLTVTALRWDGGGWEPYKGVAVFYETVYEIGGLPQGTYRVKFRGGSIWNPNSGFEEFYDDALTVDDGTDVEVVVGVTTAGIDAVLDPRGPGAIEGLVTDGAGVGVADIDVRIWNSEFELEAQEVTGADGSYRIDGLYSDRYYVDFADPQGSYPGEAYDNVASVDIGTPVFVSGGLVSGIDAVLDGSGAGPGGGGIGGVVTEATIGGPLEGIEVRCVDEFYGLVQGCSTTTAADGSYQLGGFLPEGSYLVSFEAPDGFFTSEWFDDARPPQQPTPVPVVLGAWSDAIDAGLEPAGGISGTVTNQGGGAFSRTTVTAFRWTGEIWLQVAGVDVVYDTSYELRGLPEGIYRIKFRGGSIFNPTYGIEEYFDDVLTVEEGTDVQVSVGSITTDINAVLGNLRGGDGIVTNPAFDSDLDGWAEVSPPGSSIHHGSADVGGSGLSGSAELVHAGGAAELVLSQCVAVTEGAQYLFGAWSQVGSGTPDAPVASVRLEFFANPECSGAPVAGADSPSLVGSHGWLPVTGSGAAPSGATAARVALVVDGALGGAFTAHWDEVFIGIDSDGIFSDGFETGSAGQWSAAVP